MNIFSSDNNNIFCTKGKKDFFDDDPENEKFLASMMHTIFFIALCVCTRNLVTTKCLDIEGQGTIVSEID